jgi:hypothetical protein
MANVNEIIYVSSVTWRPFCLRLRKSDSEEANDLDRGQQIVQQKCFIE